MEIARSPGYFFITLSMILVVLLGCDRFHSKPIDADSLDSKQPLLTGSNSRPTIKLATGEKSPGQLKVLSDSAVAFAEPLGGTLGLTQLNADSGRVSQTVSLSYSGSTTDIPVSTLAPADICEGIRYYDGKGQLTMGSKVCLGVVPAACSRDGQSDCVTDSINYRAAAISGAAAKIRSGQTLAGVTGNVVLPPVGKVLAASSYGVGGTGSTGTLILPTAAYVRTGSAAYGDPGSQLTPAYSPDFPAVSNVLTSDTVNSVSGTLTLPLVTRVLTGTSYGVSGNGSTGTLTLPAIANVLAGSAAYGQPGSPLTPAYSPDFPSLANVRTIDTVNGVSGTLAECNAGNSTGCITTSSYKSMDVSAASVTTDLTLTNFNATIATAANFEFWDSTGARHQVTGDSDLTAANLKSGVALFGVTGDYPSPTYPLASNTGATDLTLFTTQLTTNGSFEFFDSAGAKYNGSGDSDLVPANVKNGVAFDNFSIIGTYVATVVCPTGWIKVPGDSAYGTNDFCVMKYEAKKVSNAAKSEAGGTPWVSITQTAAITACRALGTGYDLISNAQWMTIGANVAGRASNWTSGTVGTGTLFSGHSDSSPNSACAASSDDSLFYVETDCTPAISGDAADQRRTHILSNNQVIWDFSGNVGEWVNYKNLGDKPLAGTTGTTWLQYSVNQVKTGTDTTPGRDLFPTNAVKTFWLDTWNSTQGIGQFYPGADAGGGALTRGGKWNDPTQRAGVFNATLDLAPLSSDANVGFRCVLTAPTP